jgi:hypothetical protein
MKASATFDRQSSEIGCQARCVESLRRKKRSST